MRRRTPSLIAATIGLLTPLALTVPAHADSTGAYVEGSVVDAAGHPAFGARVSLDWCSTPKGKSRDTFGCHSLKQLRGDVYTDANGFFVLDVEPGPRPHPPAGTGHYVIATGLAPRDVRAVVRVTVPRTGHDHVVAAPISLPAPSPAAPAASAYAQGTITTASGAAVPNARYTVWGTSSPSIETARYTDVWGRFTLDRMFDDAPPAGSGAVTIRVSAIGFVPKVVQVSVPDEGVTPADIELTPLPMLVGKVKVPKAGRGWRAHVNLLDATGKLVARADTDAHGRFRLSGRRIQPGTYVVAVNARRLHPSTPMRWTLGGVQLTAGTTTDIGTVTVHHR